MGLNLVAYEPHSPRSTPPCVRVAIRSFRLPAAAAQDVLTDLLRDGARRLLAQAIEAEVAAWIDAHAHLKDDAGPPPGRPQRPPPRADHPDRHRRRSRSSSPGSTTAGPPSEREAFTSPILPPYLRKTKSLEELIPWLYLKGISTGDFSEALAGDPRPRRPGPLGHDRSPGSRRSGRRSTRPGASGRWRASTTSTSGPTACTSTSAWRRAGSASWS